MTTSSVRDHAGPCVTAFAIVERKYSPARTSACGWSSFQIPDSGPESANVRFGSMNETAGNFPDLQSAKNCDCVFVIDLYLLFQRSRKLTLPQ